MKKVALVLLVVVLLAAGGLFAGDQLFSKGVGGLDDWIARKVVAVVETYLVPSGEFDRETDALYICFHLNLQD